MKNTFHAVKAALLLLCLGLLIGRAAMQGQHRATADTAAAAGQFLASLTADQRTKATIKFEDPNRFDWHYIPRPGRAEGASAEGDDPRAAASRAKAAEHDSQREGPEAEPSDHERSRTRAQG